MILTSRCSSRLTSPRSRRMMIQREIKREPGRQDEPAKKARPVHQTRIAPMIVRLAGRIGCQMVRTLPCYTACLPGYCFALVSWVLSARFAAAVEEPLKPLRAGIIGLDTSHVVAFTKLLNDASPKPEVAGVRVVAAYPGGSPDIPSSRDRVAGYTKELREKFGVKIVGSIDELLAQVDVVLLESVDGRPHLEQARPVFKARKPVFIDKPVAGTLADAIAIFDLARETNTPCFSSSSLRFSRGRSRRCGITPKWGTCWVATLMGPVILKSIIPTCSGMASTVSRRCLPSWAPAARRFRARRPRGPIWSWACGTAVEWGRFAASARAVPTTARPCLAPRGLPRRRLRRL